MIELNVRDSRAVLEPVTCAQQPERGMTVTDNAELVGLADGRLWLADMLLQRLATTSLDAKAVFRLHDEYLEHQRVRQSAMEGMTFVSREVAAIFASLAQAAELTGAVVARLRRFQSSLMDSETQHRWSSQPALASFARCLARHAQGVDDLLALLGPT